MSINYFSALPSVPIMRPAFCVGAGMDIPTGTYYIGIHGESILNSGLFHTVSLAGPGNSFKSVIIQYLNLVVADRIEQYTCGIYDTECSLNYSRLNQLASRFERISQIEHGSEDLSPDQIKFTISSSAEILGDMYFDGILKIAEIKNKSKLPLLATPFLTVKGSILSIMAPTGVMIDSLSEFKVTANEENITEKNNIGDAGNNIYFMRQGIAKKQLMTRLPNICVQSSLFFTMTAHVGDAFEIGGQFAPKKHTLTHAKKGSKITGTTKAFEFINNALYEIFDASLLNNKVHKTGVLYPAIESDREEDCTDLLIIHLKLTRNKNGPSGACVDLVVSQREGVLPHLSQFHYIKTEGNFGLIGNDKKYSLALIPDIILSRTTVRNIIDKSTKIRRSLEILSEMLQIKNLWADLPDNLMCTPEELYNDIKALGYDWDILLNTRGYWVFTESNINNLPYLSTLDLLKIRKELYFPYFLNEDKLTYKKDIKHLLNN